MIAYHGTTQRRARRIALEGFLPRKPSRRVWFATSKAYAEGRARTQARRSHDRPVVLACNLDVDQLRRRVGTNRVFRRAGNIAIDGPVPVTVLREHQHLAQEVPTTADGLAACINQLLGLKPHKGVARSNPGLQRLTRWVRNRVTSRPDTKLSAYEVLGLAKQWLPEFFEGAEIDPERLKVRRIVKRVQVRHQVEPPPAPPDRREDEALELLAGPRPAHRARGLKRLAEIEDPDLFDWCVMFLDDEAAEVRVAALRTMLRCEDGDPEVIAPLARSTNKRVRAAAIAALARHSGGKAAGWFERGLKDPDACVRLAAAAQLGCLDPNRHRAIFELALYDPNPQVAHLAAKLTAGKGYAKAPRP